MSGYCAMISGCVIRHCIAPCKYVNVYCVMLKGCVNADSVSPFNCLSGYDVTPREGARVCRYFVTPKRMR